MRLGVGLFVIVLAEPAWAQDASLFTLPPSAANAATQPSEPPEPEPPEPTAPPFGSRGQLVVSNESDLGVSYTQYESRAEYLYLTAAPAIDWFVLRNLSIGASATLAYSDTKGFGADDSIIRVQGTGVSIGARIGFNVPLGRFASLDPHAALGVSYSHSDTSLIQGSSTSIPSPVNTTSPTVVGPWLSFYLPILIHPTQHFFVGFGPSIFHAFGRVTGGPDEGAERTTIGAQTIVGTYWGGVPPPPRPDVVTRTRRFGDHHDVVITGASDVYGFWTTYQGTSANRTSLSFSPGVDVFVGYRVAVGLSLDAYYETAQGVDAMTGRPVTSESTSFAGGPRLAYDIPLGRWLSWYPRGRIIFGYRHHDLASNGIHNTYGEAIILLGLYAPLLVHVAPHMFMGFGPSVAYDVLHQDEGPLIAPRQNRALSAGAGWIVGGWL